MLTIMFTQEQLETMWYELDDQITNERAVFARYKGRAFWLACARLQKLLVRFEEVRELLSVWYPGHDLVRRHTTSAPVVNERVLPQWCLA